MKRIVATLMVLGICITALSQKLDTVYRNAGYGQMEHIGLFKESNGATIIAGTYASSVNDIDPGAATVALPTASNFGFYLIKYSVTGAYVNHLSVQGTANVIAQDAARDAAGNYYVVGDITGTADFDPSGAVFNVSSGTANRKAFIAKYDQNFNFLSVNTFTSTNYSSFESIKIDGAGKIYLGGYFWGTQDVDFGPGIANETSANTASNMFVIYDSNLNLVNRVMNMGRYRTLCEVDNSGNIYLAGTYDANTDFDPSPSTYTLNATGVYDVFIAKYNASMTLQWAGKIGNANGTSVTQLKLDAFGNPLLAGTFSGTVDFDISSTSTSTLTSVATDNFLLRISALGIFHWARYYQSNNATTNVMSDIVNVDNNNNVYFTGGFSGTKNFNNGGVAFNMTATGDMDGFVEKLDNTGIQQWCFRFGGGASGYNYTGGHCISVENTGQINLIGSMRAVNDFDPSPYDSVSIATYGGFYNSFIARYNQLKTLAIATPSLCAGNSIAIPYSINGSCNSGNVFTAQLSDAAGSFTAPVSIGSLNATQSGTIMATIPSTVAYGTNYRVRVVSSNPIQKGERNNANILISSAPSVLSQPVSKTVCVNANTTFTSAVSSNSAAVQWYFNSLPVSTATTAILNITSAQQTQAGNYYVIVSNGCGSANSNTVTLTVNSPTVSVSGTRSLCTGQSTTLTASGAVNYSWNTGSNSSSITSSPSVNTNYTVTGADAQGCIDTETLTVVVNAVPSVSISVSNPVICQGQPVTLTASGANTYSWTSGVTNGVSFNPTTTLTYTVIGTSTSNCTNSAAQTITVNPLPALIASTSNTMLCSGQTATLTVSGATSYTWNTSATTPVISISPTVTTNYTVSGTGANGCVNTTTVSQNVTLCSGIAQVYEAMHAAKLYPNPTQGIITIELESINEPISIRVINALGEIIYIEEIKTTSTLLNLSSLEKGVYVIQLHSEKGVANHKLILE